MSHRCLADFLEELARTGQLVRVEATVDAVLEAAEITARVGKTNGPSVLFGAVSGHETPLVANLLGSEERILRALGVRSIDDAAERIAGAIAADAPAGWFEKLKAVPQTATLGKLRPQVQKSGAVQQVVRLGRDVDLGELPLLQNAPNEAHRVITAGIVIAADPNSRRQIGGRWDLELLEPNRLAVCWADDDEPARLLKEYASRGEPMPLAVTLGGDPAVILAGCAPVPPAVDTLALAGLLRQKPLNVIACRTQSLQVPADADIVIEGHIDPSEPLAPAGPRCGPGGQYTLPRPAPVMQVTAITHRANPVLPAMVAGRPPNEACAIARALARVFLPLARMAIAEMVDYALPEYGSARHWAVVSIRKSYAGQSRRVADAAWGLRQLRFAKVLVVVDEGVDVHDDRQVLSAVSANMHPGRDVFLRQGPVDVFDPAAVPGELGHRMGIDATAKLPGEHSGTWLQSAEMSESIGRLVNDRWAEYGLGEGVGE